MPVTELQEIKDYWAKKYPNVFISLWKNDDDKYFGKMIAYNNSIDIQADTVGELISEGEIFLRKVM